MEGILPSTGTALQARTMPIIVIIPIPNIPPLALTALAAVVTPTNPITCPLPAASVLALS
ncbi:MAG: hypothetical protein LQ345_004597 [Seirophora villosa]|nr:MAG: hypothetical protein LQ345_004597 [Seirophora villosa]